MIFLYVILAILMLLLMITIHEAGHYVAGKALGFGINEFSIGFGPKLLSRRLRSGEVFSVRALPIGGFCSFVGEDGKDHEESLAMLQGLAFPGHRGEVPDDRADPLVGGVVVFLVHRHISERFAINSQCEETSIGNLKEPC